MNYSVALVGFEEGENLGLRYIASFLISKGVSTIIIPYRPDSKERILQSLLLHKPKIVGFSLIFQRMLDDFNELISYLRKNNITSHFTMGGHFPSIEPDKVLGEIRHLDSIIRCEGEITLLELYNNIGNPELWDGIDGLVFRKNASVITNKFRELIVNLDELPFPLRNQKPYTHKNIGLSTILSSRGCYYNCCFCSIHEFYKDSKGKNRRRRTPQNVVKEILHLFKTYNTRIFIFEDDDFPLKGERNVEWINAFVDDLKRFDLHDKIIWRISTRIDEVDKSILKELMNYGLISVYLGIESGNDYSLKLFNKRYTESDVYNTLGIFEELNLPYEFGFMLLHPYCTFDTIAKDLIFLRNISGSGLTNIHFTKMIPYAGTQIEKDMIEVKRFKGSICNPDYNYLDERIDYYQLFLSLAFHHRNFDKNGLLESLRYAKFDQIIQSKFHAASKGANNELIKNLMRLSNYTFINAASKGLLFMQGKSLDDILNGWSELEGLINEEKHTETSIIARIQEVVAV